MSRFIFLTLALSVGMGAMAYGQDADEIKRLKERIELLEAKLELAKRDNEALQLRIAELEKGETKKVKNSPLTVGSRWVGFLEITAPKSLAQSAKATIEITKVEDGRFEATYEALELVAAIAGTVQGDRITWKFQEVIKTPPKWAGRNFAANLQVKSGVIRGERITGLFNWPEVKTPDFSKAASSGNLAFDLVK